MRADRLVAMLLLMQNRGRLTAGQLADELEVSVRTIYRDVESLMNAGVPVVPIRGPQGGFELVDGYRTQLTGFTGDEAESLFLVGMPGPASELGLDDSLARAELKLVEALPSELRIRAHGVRNRFHHDPTAWSDDRAPNPTLAILTQAVWKQQGVFARYRDGGEILTLQPLGLALKSEKWWLVAVDSAAAVFEVEQLHGVTASGNRFDRPGAFELAAFWSDWVRSVESDDYGLAKTGEEPR